MTHILFVCLGNICRSPTAEAVMRHLAKQNGLEDQIIVDSAGLNSYHIGESPDSRSQRHARERGYELGELRARQVTAQDFIQFDWILAADTSNLRALERLCPVQYRHKLQRILSGVPGENVPIDLPDPYYGGSEDFERVLDLVEVACQQLLQRIVSGDLGCKY